MICDGRGTPLAVTLTAANRNDIAELLPLVDQGPADRPARQVPAQEAARRPRV